MRRGDGGAVAVGDSSSHGSAGALPIIGALENSEAPVESERVAVRGGDGDVDAAGDSSSHG